MLTTLPESLVTSICHRGVAIVLALWALAPIARSQTPGAIDVTGLPAHAAGISVMDAAGNLYVGAAGASTYPVTAGAAQTQPGGGDPGSCQGSSTANARPQLGVRWPIPPPAPCTDAYLTKVDPHGNTVYATFLGGPRSDFPTAAAIDAAGDLYVAGVTYGLLPTTPNAAIPASTTSTAFAAKLNPGGTAFLYVTYLPDTFARPAAIQVDSAGNAYLAGVTAANHAVVMEISADGSSFPRTTVLAGSGQDAAQQLALDPSGNLVVSGLTSSPDFPVTAGAAQPTYAGNQDLFIAKLDPKGRTLFATYLGGSGAEYGASLQLDAAGNIYLTGIGASTDFPTTPGSFQPAPIVPFWNRSAPGGFLTSLSADGTAFRYSTYIPTSDGSANVGGPGLLSVSPAGDVYLLDAALAGSPVTPSAPQPCYNGAEDAFLAHFDPRGQLADSTFLGEVPSHVSLSSNNYLPADGSVTVLSTSAGPDATPALLHVRFGDAAWSAPACLTPAALNSALLLTRGAIAAGEIVTFVGRGIGPDQGVAYQPGPQAQAPSLLGGVQVFFDGIAAPLLYASSTQVNAVAPSAILGQTSTRIALQYQGATFGPFSQTVALFDPGIFRAQPGVSSQAVATNQDGVPNGPDHPAPAGSIVSVWGTGFGPLTTACRDGMLNIYGADNLAANYTAVLNGQNGLVSYAGGAPEFLCGVEQINLQIPPGTPPGNFFLYPTMQYASGGTYIGSTSFLGATVVVK